MSNGIDFKNDFVPALIDWIREETGLRYIVWKRLNRDAPKGPYCTLDLITPLIKNQFTDSMEYVSGTSFNRGGQRSFTLNIQFYSENEADYFEPINFATKIQDSLENPNVQQKLRDSGMAIFGDQGIVDTSELLETGFQPRASIDVIFGVASNRVIDIGIIEQVKFQGNYDSQDDDEITVN